LAFLSLNIRDLEANILRRRNEPCIGLQTEEAQAGFRRPIEI